MAKFKNLEMSSTLSTNPDITVSKGFLGFGAKAIYTHTNTPLKAIINYYGSVVKPSCTPPLMHIIS